MANDSNKPFHTWRCIFGLVYLVLGVGTLVFARHHLFYAAARDSFADWPRFVCCVAGNFIGFGFLLLRRLRFSSEKPFPLDYVWYFPGILLVCSSLVFAACHVYQNTAGHLFYFVALPVSFVTGYLVDDFWPSIKKCLSKVEPSP